MKDNTARKFENNETIERIKQNLDVSTLNNFLITSPDKAIAYIGYWEKKKLNATSEQKNLYELEVVKMETLMQRMADMSMDVYGVQASQWLDTKGFEPEIPIKETIEDVAPVQTVEKSTQKETPVIDIFTGDEKTKNPKLSDLAKAVKQLLKKGNFDSAQLMATQYLSIGSYVPKKEKQTPRKWSEAEVDSWIKDINNSLLNEKQETIATPVKDVVEVEAVTTVEELNEDAASKGLTLGEVERYRLLCLTIPSFIAGHGDHGSIREKLNTALNLGKDLNKENELLWQFNDRIAGAYIESPKLPKSDLASLLKDLDSFKDVFFKHRGYTQKSVDAWFEASKKDVHLSNFKYLTSNKEGDPLKMKQADQTYNQINTWIEKQVENGVGLPAVIDTLTKTTLYKNIKTNDNNDIPIYTRLHAEDLFSRMYSVHATKAKTVSNDKINVSEIKLLLTTIAENAGLIEDVKSHPEIIGLIGKEIEKTSKSTTMGTMYQSLIFKNEEELFPWIEDRFKEVVDRLEVIKLTNDEAATTVTDGIASLDDLLASAETAAKTNVTEETFFNENVKSIKDDKGKFLQLKSKIDRGSIKTLIFSGAKDFKNWISEVYSIQNKLKEHTTEEVVGETTSIKTVDEIHAEITEASKLDGAKFVTLARQLRDEYVANNIVNKDGKNITGHEALNILENIVKESNPEMYNSRIKRRTANEVRLKGQSKLEFEEVKAEVNTEPVVENTVDVPHEVFTKVDVSKTDPELWKTIEKFKTLDDVHTMALEFEETGKLNEGLSMCLDIMPNIEVSKDWDPAQITLWYNTIVLNRTNTKEEETVDAIVDTNAPVIEISEEFKAIQGAKDKKAFRKAVAQVLETETDNKELRIKIIESIKSATSSYTRQLSKMTDAEIHKNINSIKERIEKYK